MRKLGIIAVAITVLLLISVFAPMALSTGPTQPPVDTTTLYVGTIAWGPVDADPAAAYDTGSGELIFNSYDTLLQMGQDMSNAFKTYPDVWDVQEQYWEFSPSLSLNVPTRAEVIETFNQTAFSWVIDIRNQEPVPPPPITDPVCTWWEDDLPQPFMTYHVHGWVDVNQDGILGPSDLVELEIYWWAPALPEKVHLIGEFWFHVEDLQFYPPTDYKLVLTWVPTPGVDYPVCTWLTNAAHPGKVYHVCGYVDNNPDGKVGPTDVVYIGEFDVVPVTWEKIGVGTTYLPVTCRTWSVISAQLGPSLGLYLHHYYYDFNVRLTDGDGTTGNPIHFVDHTGALGNALTIDDYVYTFQREITQDYIGGPEWMFFKPFFDQMNTGWWDTGISEDPICLAWLINDVVEIISTNPPVIRINLGIAFPDTAFKQIMSQTWASIVSKQWCIDKGCWNGDLFKDADQNSLLDWWEIRSPDVPPFDTVQPNDYYGTGPYFVAVADPSIGEGLVVLQRNPYYWKGWPAKDRKSYLEYVDIEYISTWATRRDAFIACQLDVCAVPRGNMYELLDAYGDPIYPEIKTVKAITPVLTMDAIFFVFNLSAAGNPSIYSGKFPGGIPYNFFNNTYVRQAFADSINFSQYLSQAYKGEAVRRETPFVVGLSPDYYAAEGKYHQNTATYVPGATVYDLDYDKVINDLKAAMFTQDSTTKSVWDWGDFKLDVFYNTGNDPRRIAMEMMKATFDKINTDYGKNFVINIVSLKWSQIVKKLLTFTCPIFVIGWLADFADADNWYRPYMHSYGDFSGFQAYGPDYGWTTTGPRTGLTKDVLIDLGVKTPDGSYRQDLYNDLDDIYITDCPSFPIAQATGRRWCKYWVRGWYYNVLYPSQYYYKLYKEDTCWCDVTGSGAPGIPDDRENMRDIGYIAQHFGAKAPDPTKTPAYDPKWADGAYGMGGCDVYGDRKVDMRDVGFACSHFGHLGVPIGPGGP